jgi:hypothetical protein
MKGTESKPAVPKEKLLQAIQFLNNRAKLVGKMQRYFGLFTDKFLKDIVEESKSLTASRVSILWHDFIFVFFQFFIGMYM